VPHYDWAGVDNTNGFNGYWPNPGVKTDGIPMPATRVGRGGAQPIYIGSIYRDFGTGPASVWQGIYYQGYESQGGLGPLGSSGGTFTFFIRGSAGTLQFGRCTGCGRSVQSENEAFSWGGTLAGALDYAEVPTAPQDADAYLDTTTGVFSFGLAGSASDGGSGLTAYIRQMSVNGGAYGSATTSWNSTVQGVQGNTYQFEFWARNGVGDSLSIYTAPQTVPYRGGRRMTGPSASTPLQTTKRFNGSSWVDLTTRKRHNGASFVEISN